MFAAEFEPASSLTRRGSPRAPASIDVRIRLGWLGRALCKVVDVSIHGARLQTYTALKKGSTIWLTLPDVGQIAADIVWADDFTAGCHFHAPLEPASLDLLLVR